MSKKNKCFVSTEGRILDQSRWEPLLWAYGKIYGTTMREVYVRLIIKGEKKQAIRSELIKRGWKEDEADSIIDTAKAAQEAAVESMKLALDNTRRQLEEVEKKLSWAMAGTSQKRKHQRHGLCRRRDKLQARVINIEKRLEENQVRVCFGGRKLARAGNHPEASGYKDHTEWRARWDRKRSGVIYVKGDSEASHGNCCAKIILDPDGQDKLRLRIHDLSLKLGDGSEVALRDLSDGAEWVELLVEGFVYGRGEIEAVLQPYESASEEKARWYIVASTSPLQQAILTKPSRELRRRFARILGIDLNPDHVAWCVIDKEGNPLAWGKVSLDLTGSVNQKADSIGRAIAEVVRIAKRYDAVIVHEQLDFSRSRAQLRYECSKRLADLLSSFAYNKFFSTLASRCRREGLERVSVNPAWTSVLGQANYAGVYGVSVDQAAACVIYTSIDQEYLDALGALSAHKGLAVVEGDFYNMKAIDLDLAPIYHYTEDRVRAHVFICMLAAYLLW